MIFRHQIINSLIQKNKYKTYLEIGVAEKYHCFDIIECETKHSVDPCYEIPDAIVDYKYESDLFFKLLENNDLNILSTFKWDIIFIDGLHISTQVEKDLINSLNHLSDNGTIILHDCNPPTIYHAREVREDDTVAKNYWNGTVWKVLYKYRATRPDLNIYTVDDDWGVGVITRGQQKCCAFDNPFYEFELFDKNRKEYLNLISEDDFIKIKLGK